ncbi:hypothetical protein [Kitasatospora griseola]|uniref:hypothetical protein n=1 Tax=Kitasatospora griseola TaxID=2064 RepID=UPI00341AE8CF
MPDRTTTALRRLARANRDAARAMAQDFQEGTSANEIARRAKAAFSRPVVLEMIKAELAIQELRDAVHAVDTPFGNLYRHVRMHNTGRFVTVAMPGIPGMTPRLGDHLTVRAVKTITAAGLRLRPLSDYPSDTDPAFVLRCGDAVEVYKPSL